MLESELCRACIEGTNVVDLRLLPTSVVHTLIILIARKGEIMSTHPTIDFKDITFFLVGDQLQKYIDLLSKDRLEKHAA